MQTKVALDDSFDFSVGRRTLVLQPDGKLVAAGTAYGPNGIPDFALMRLDVNGMPDASFSGDGMALYDLGGGDCAYSAQLLADG